MFIHMFPLNVGLFFLSIPIPGFVPSDRFAWNGPAPMVFRHKTLHLTAELNRQRKYKRKSTTIGSRNIRLISRENDLS